MRNGPSTFRPDRTAADLYATMQRANLTTAPVTTSDGRLVWVVFRDDLAHALRE